MSEGVEWLGYEEVDGVRCAHLGFSMAGRELLRMRLQEDSSLAEKYPDLDSESLENLLGDLRVEIWVAVDDKLPVQILIQSEGGKEGIGISNRVRMVFSAYHEEPPIPLDRPAVYTEAG